MTALVALGQLAVSPRLRRHPHVVEARTLCIAKQRAKSAETVLGTTNDHGPVTELYGWAPVVAKHVDRTGFVYFMPLRLPRGGSLVYAGEGPRCHTEVLQVGRIYRLDDHEWHGTYELGPVVCMFRGPYQAQADGEATVALDKGLRALEQRSDGAPRVSDGFRSPLRGECWALVDKEAALVPLKVARAKNYVIATCTICEAPAFTLDHSFPYFWDGNRCLQHLAAMLPAAA